MKRINPESIGDVLRQTIERNGMSQRLFETRAVSAWPLIIGSDLAAMMGRPFVANGVMTIYVRSASLRQEMNMHRSRLVKAINSHLGRDVISDIRFK